MVKEVTQYECAATGKLFFTKEAAERSEAEHSLYKKLRGAVSAQNCETIYSDTDYAVMLEAMKMCASDVIPLLAGKGVLGNVIVSVSGDAGAGKMRVIQLLECAHGNTHNFRYLPESSNITVVEITRKTGDN